MLRTRLASTFDLFGYISLYTQLMWLLLPFVPSMLQNKVLVPDPENVPAIPVQNTVANNAMLPEWVAIFLGMALFLSAIVFFVFAVRKSARVTVDAGNDVTRKMSDAMLPHLIVAKKMSKSRRLHLNNQLQLLIKLSASVILFLLLGSSELVESPLQGNIIYFGGFVLMLWTGFWLTTAYSIKR